MRLFKAVVLIVISQLALMSASPSFAQTKNSCNDWNVLRFSDDTTGCMTDYKFFTVPAGMGGSRVNGGIAEIAILRKYNFSVALVKAPNKCAINQRATWGGDNDSPAKAIESCQKMVTSKALERGQSPDNCECETIYSFEYGGKPNVPIPRKNFEEKVRAWTAIAQNGAEFKEFFSPQEREANAKFFMEYKQRLDVGDGSNNPNASLVTQSNQNKQSMSIVGSDIKPSLSPKQTSCSFKTQIKYPDGSSECIDGLPLAEVIPFGEKSKLIELINGTKDYAIAKSSNLQCSALGFGSALTNNASISSNLAKEAAITSCNKSGCACELVIQSGVSLVPRDKILANLPSSAMLANVEGKRIQQKNASLNKKIGSCSFKTQIKYQDGSTECIDDTQLANQIPIGQNLSLVDLINGTRDYVVAQSKNPKCTAIGFGAMNANIPGGALVEASRRAVTACSDAGCNCEPTISNGTALVPKGQIFANLNKVDGDLEVVNQNAVLADKTQIEQDNFEKQSQLRKNQQLEFAKQQREKEQKLVEERRIQAELAEKARVEREQKLAEEKRIQAEFAAKAQAEKEQKLADEKRIQAELAEKARLEREQKLAEEKRTQAEAAAKAQTEKEQKLAEERRLRAELAAKIQAEKEQRELALKQQKEAELKAKAQLAAESSSRTQAIGKRLALVIGNAKYQQRPLDNAVNDANDISKALKASGFEVIDIRDANLSQMRAAVRNFGDRLLNNDVGLVYYSGHGVEVKGKNYFIPVNADIRRSDEIADQSLDVGLVLDKMETAQKPVNILIVDACRDDPFGRSFRSGSRGLATMDAPQGTIIAFATSPGKVAADGDGRNSPYTKNLVQAMQEPNVPIEQVFKKVRRAVQQETRNQQTPWENTSLSGDFYFKVQ